MEPFPTLVDAVEVLKSGTVSAEEQHRALESIVSLLAQEKVEHPERYQESLALMRDFLKEVHAA